MQPVWAQHSVRVRRSLNLWEQSPLIWYVESRVRPINAENCKAAADVAEVAKHLNITYDVRDAENAVI